MTYGPPGWPAAMTVADQDGAEVFAERLTYTEGGYDGAGYFDGKIANVATTGNGSGGSYRFAYDALSRLSVAERTEVGQPPDTTRLSYDINGNFTSVSVETAGADTVTTRRNFHYQPYSDRLDTVTVDGSPVDAFRYDAGERRSMPSGAISAKSVMIGLLR